MEVRLKETVSPKQRKFSKEVLVHRESKSAHIVVRLEETVSQKKEKLSKEKLEHTETRSKHIVVWPADPCRWQ
jgi:hypothetical protein